MREPTHNEVLEGAKSEIQVVKNHNLLKIVSNN